MHRIAQALIVTFLLAATAVVSRATAADRFQEVRVRVDGMACPFCAYGLEKKLKRIDGVEKLDIKINDGVVILYFSEDAKVDRSLIEKKIEEAGFTPREIEVKESTVEEKGPKETTRKTDGTVRCVSPAPSAPRDGSGERGWIDIRVTWGDAVRSGDAFGDPVFPRPIVSTPSSDRPRPGRAPCSRPTRPS